MDYSLVCVALIALLIGLFIGWLARRPSTPPPQVKRTQMPQSGMPPPQPTPNVDINPTAESSAQRLSQELEGEKEKTWKLREELKDAYEKGTKAAEDRIGKAAEERIERLQQEKNESEDRRKENARVAEDRRLQLESKDSALDSLRAELQKAEKSRDEARQAQQEAERRESAAKRELERKQAKTVRFVEEPTIHVFEPTQEDPLPSNRPASGKTAQSPDTTESQVEQTRVNTPVSKVKDQAPSPSIATRPVSTPSASGFGIGKMFEGYRPSTDAMAFKPAVSQSRLDSRGLGQVLSASTSQVAPSPTLPTRSNSFGIDSDIIKLITELIEGFSLLSITSNTNAANSGVNIDPSGFTPPQSTPASVADRPSATPATTSSTSNSSSEMEAVPAVPDTDATEPPEFGDSLRSTAFGRSLTSGAIQPSTVPTVWPWYKVAQDSPSTAAKTNVDKSTVYEFSFNSPLPGQAQSAIDFGAKQNLTTPTGSSIFRTIAAYTQGGTLSQGGSQMTINTNANAANHGLSLDPLGLPTRAFGTFTQSTTPANNSFDFNNTPLTSGPFASGEAESQANTSEKMDITGDNDAPQSDPVNQDTNNGSSPNDPDPDHDMTNDTPSGLDGEEVRAPPSNDPNVGDEEMADQDAQPDAEQSNNDDLPDHVSDEDAEYESDDEVTAQHPLQYETPPATGQAAQTPSLYPHLGDDHTYGQGVSSPYYGNGQQVRDKTDDLDNFFQGNMDFMQKNGIMGNDQSPPASQYQDPGLAYSQASQTPIYDPPSGYNDLYGQASYVNQQQVADETDDSFRPQDQDSYDSSQPQYQNPDLAYGQASQIPSYNPPSGYNDPYGQGSYVNQQQVIDETDGFSRSQDQDDDDRSQFQYPDPYQAYGQASQMRSPAQQSMGYSSVYGSPPKTSQPSSGFYYSYGDSYRDTHDFDRDEYEEDMNAQSLEYLRNRPEDQQPATPAGQQRRPAFNLTSTTGGLLDDHLKQNASFKQPPKTFGTFAAENVDPIFKNEVADAMTPDQSALGGPAPQSAFGSQQPAPGPSRKRANDAQDAPRQKRLAPTDDEEPPTQEDVEKENQTFYGALQ